MDITVHQARKLTAKAEHNGTSHWVDGDIGAASADRLAAAINDAKAEGA